MTSNFIFPLLALAAALPAAAQDNHPPAVQGVHLEPGAPTADQDLRCVTGDLIDEDGDEVGRRYRWLVDGEPLQGQFQSTLSASRTLRGQVIACEVTPHDGISPGAAVTAEAVTVVGKAPVVDGASLTPAEPTVAAALKCVPGSVSDADGDEVTLRYTWTVAKKAVEVDGPTLAPEHFRRGRSVACAITPLDGELEGETVEAGPVTVVNALPVVASVAVSPAAPGTSDNLVCETGERTDADGDPVKLRYAWTVDGEPGGTSRTLYASKTALGQRITCAVTASDGRGQTEPVTSAEVTVGDSLPTLGDVTLSPASPDAGQDLRCDARGARDTDGQEVSLGFRWLVDGAALEGQDRPTLAAAHTRKGQRITCEVTPRAGEGAGEARSSEAVTVGNSLPAVTSAALTPAAPAVTSTLTCTGTGVEDADGDEVSLRYAWTVGGRLLDVQGATLAPEHLRKAQSVTCAITPHDGEAEGAAVRSNRVTVGNTPPVLTGVQVEPGQPTTADTLRCVPGEASDADGDAVRFAYRWLVDGEASSASGSTLSSTLTRGNQSIRCEATPSDGLSTGEAVASAPVVIANSPPTLAAARITPAQAVSTDTLTCAGSGARDADGDEVTLAIAWTVDGEAAGTGATLGPDRFAKGQAVRCEITPSDGKVSGAAVLAPPPVVRNSPPALGEVVLSPTSPGTGQTIRAAVTATDADGDEVALKWQWTANGRPLPVDGPALGAEHTRRGQRIQVTVTPSDGEATGRAVRSESLTIANTPPDAPVVVVGDPGGGYRDLVCHLLSEVEDADGDRVSYRFEWTVDGAAWSGAGTTKRPGDTVPPSATSSDQEWVCTARATDGVAWSPPGSQAVAILEPRVNAGSGHSCGLDTRGVPWCWGTDEHRAASPPQGAFRRISTGSWHNCVLDADGAIACWGHDRYGQCTGPQEGGFVQVSAGAYHTCAVHEDGRVVCWGQDDLGQSAAPAGRFASVEAGWQHTCALDLLGQVHCWGDDTHGRATPPSGKFTQVSAGSRHSCGLRPSGQVLCWGDGEFGQTAVPEGRYVQVRAGEMHSCALTDLGGITCWGKDDFGQATAPEGRFLWLGEATNHQCAIDDAVGIRCWGRDNYGQTRVPSPP